MWRSLEANILVPINTTFFVAKSKSLLSKITYETSGKQVIIYKKIDIFMEIFLYLIT